MDEEEHLQQLALEECSVSVVNKLDVSAILPNLMARHLLTSDNRQVLMTCAKTQVEKAQYLLDILPRKNHGWFEQFVECLRETSDGTGHDDLVKELEAKLQEIKSKITPKKSGKKKFFKLGGKSSPMEESPLVASGTQSDVSDIQNH